MLISIDSCCDFIKSVAAVFQALTTTERLNSKPSEPLEVTWPGVQPPVLVKAPAHSGNAVRVTWDVPNCTGGVKIKQYKVRVHIGALENLEIVLI